MAPATDPKFKTLGEQLSNLLQFAWGPGRPRESSRRPVPPRDPGVAFSPATTATTPRFRMPEQKRMDDRDDDPKTPLDDLWGEMKMPILYFGNARMPGDWLLNGIYSAQKSGSPDVTINVLEGYGHLDVLVSDHARRDVFEPTLAWIRAVPRP